MNLKHIGIVVKKVMAVIFGLIKLNNLDLSRGLPSIKDPIQTDILGRFK